MNANNILSANLLDIIFEGKNKDYGAYELRKTYNKRISISLLVTLGIIAILLIASTNTHNYIPKDLAHIQGPDVVIQPPPPSEIPLPPPPPILPPPPVATIAFPPPLVVKDELVLKPPPDIRELLAVKIDTKTVEGTKDIGYVNPPSDIAGSRVLSKPEVKNNPDTVFYRVEIEASFPGGASEWARYVSKAIQRNLDEFTEADYGTCDIKFIVDKAGKVSQVEATTMKGSKLAEVATNAIRKGPDWIPARQNGSYVNAYHLQPVILKDPNQ